MQASTGVNCDDTYPLRSVPIAFCLRRFPDGRSGNLEPSPAHNAQQIVEFEEGVFEAAEETTKEDEKRAEEIAEKSGKAPQKLALRAAVHPPRAQIAIPPLCFNSPTVLRDLDHYYKSWFYPTNA